MEQHLEIVITLLRAGLGISHPRSFPQDLDWSQVISIADFHHVVPTVASGLRTLAMHDAALQPVSLFLDELAQAQLERNKNVARELARLVAELNRARVIPLVLKGGAFIAENNFAPSEWRFMSDIDILVRPNEINETISVLSRAGYSNDPEIYRPEHDNHLPGFFSPDSSATIDVHTRI